MWWVYLGLGVGYRVGAALKAWAWVFVGMIAADASMFVPGAEWAVVCLYAVGSLIQYVADSDAVWDWAAGVSG